MSRKLKSWLEGYLSYVKETEPHTRYHIWVAIMLVAASLGRKANIIMGPETFFPNLYIVLVGPAAGGKSTAIRYGQKLLEKADTVIIAPAGRVTDQQLYVELEDAGRAVQWPGGGTFQHHTMLVIASELVMFLGETKGTSKKAGTDRLADMCALYDEDAFTYRTKGSGVNTVINPGLFLLGATTPLWITSSMPTLAIAGGPTSRTLFVYSAGKEKLIPLTQMKPFDVKLEAELIHDLREISKLIGTFTTTANAAKFYENWYSNIHPTLDLKDQRLETYLGRMPIMLVKTAMCLSACRDNSMIITEKDFVGALRMLNNANRHMGKAFGHQGHNIMGAQTELFRELLEKKSRASQAEILSTLRMHIGKREYEIIRDTLLAEGFLNMIVDADGNQILVKK